ncbi:hypothetical protein J6590_077631 [Homalodisca vitripennis]|nr:hypothetical protein J6590_077631 [Homalodisca vitripennis]
MSVRIYYYNNIRMSVSVKESMNSLSRFRPFPYLFGKSILILRNAHSSPIFTHIFWSLLMCGCSIPHAAKCIVLTGLSIPIRILYRRVLRSQCYINISCNHTKKRSKPFETEFLEYALPTEPLECETFGLSLVEETDEFKLTLGSDYEINENRLRRVKRLEDDLDAVNLQTLTGKSVMIEKDGYDGWKQGLNNMSIAIRPTTLCFSLNWQNTYS